MIKVSLSQWYGVSSGGGWRRSPDREGRCKYSEKDVAGRSRGIKVAAPPLDLPCDGPLTYPGDIKTLRIPSKERSGPTLNMTTRLG